MSSISAPAQYKSHQHAGPAQILRAQPGLLNAVGPTRLRLDTVELKWDAPPRTKGEPAAAAH